MGFAKQIGHGMRIKAFYQMACNILLVKKLVRHKMALFQKPNKNQTGNQTNGTLIVELIVICLVVKVVWKTNDFIIAQAYQSLNS